MLKAFGINKETSRIEDTSSQKRRHIEILAEMSYLFESIDTHDSLVVSGKGGTIQEFYDVLLSILFCQLKNSTTICINDIALRFS